MFYIVTIQSTGEGLLFLAIASMANNCKIGECQKNSRQSDSFIVCDLQSLYLNCEKSLLHPFVIFLPHNVE